MYVAEMFAGKWPFRRWNLENGRTAATVLFDISQIISLIPIFSFAAIGNQSEYFGQGLALTLEAVTASNMASSLARNFRGMLVWERETEAARDTEE